MKLEDYYYKIISIQRCDTGGTFHIALLPECNVYQGHFPGNPVCPGVCNIQTIKECAQILTGSQLCLHHIRRCRLTAVATPTTCPELDIRVKLTPAAIGYTVEATISDNRQTYMEMKGEMTA